MWGQKPLTSVFFWLELRAIGHNDILKEFLVKICISDLNPHAFSKQITTKEGQREKRWRGCGGILVEWLQNEEKIRKKSPRQDTKDQSSCPGSGHYRDYKNPHMGHPQNDIHLGSAESSPWTWNGTDSNSSLWGAVHWILIPLSGAQSFSLTSHILLSTSLHYNPYC